MAEFRQKRAKGAGDGATAPLLAVACESFSDRGSMTLEGGEVACSIWAKGGGEDDGEFGPGCTGRKAVIRFQMRCRLFRSRRSNSSEHHLRFSVA